jgi:hypothetical protein
MFIRSFYEEDYFCHSVDSFRFVSFQLYLCRGGAKFDGELDSNLKPV